jgi:hypothetical protein
MEKAIRNALQKAGPDAAPAQRAHVYQSARNALENSLRKQNIADPKVVAAQRDLLEKVIHSVERDMVLAQMEREAREKREQQRRESLAAPTGRPLHPKEPEFEEADDHYASEPEMGADDGSEAIEPQLEDEPVDFYEEADEAEQEDDRFYKSPDRPERIEHFVGEIDEPPARAAKPRRVRRWKAKAFALLTVAAFVALGWWWVESSGLLLTAQQRDKMVPNPPPTAQDEDFDGAQQLKSLSRQGGYGEEWTKLYDAASSQGVTNGADVTTTLKNGGSGPYLDIVSSSTGPEGAVSIEIPQELVARMQGRASSIAVTLQGADRPVQVAVECEFGGLGNCGRHRFLLSSNRSDLLFEVNIPADGEVAGPGKLTINPDAGGEASAAKLYTIHILPGG